MKKMMKKWIAILLVVAMALSSTGCVGVYLAMELADRVENGEDGRLALEEPACTETPILAVPDGQVSQSPAFARQEINFSDMEYVHPDTDAIYAAIDALEAEGSITKTVQVTAKPAAQPQSHNVTVSMKYQYIDHKTVSRNDCSTEEIISIPVVQVDRFQLTSVEIEPQVMVGEEVYLSVEYVNKGRSEVYNLSASVSGDNIENPGQNQNLGNLSSGSTGSADFYIRAAESGPVSGLITVVYEDTNMQEKTLTIPFSTEAQSYEDLYGDQMGMYNPPIRFLVLLHNHI